MIIMKPKDSQIQEVIKEGTWGFYQVPVGSCYYKMETCCNRWKEDECDSQCDYAPWHCGYEVIYNDFWRREEIKFFNRYYSEHGFNGPELGWNGSCYFLRNYFLQVKEGNVKILSRLNLKKKTEQIFLYEGSSLINEVPSESYFLFHRLLAQLNNPCIQISAERKGTNIVRTFITVQWEDFKKIVMGISLPDPKEVGTCLNQRLLNKRRQSLIEICQEFEKGEMVKIH